MLARSELWVRMSEPRRPRREDGKAAAREPLRAPTLDDYEVRYFAAWHHLDEAEARELIGRFADDPVALDRAARKLRRTRARPAPAP